MSDNTNNGVPVPEEPLTREEKYLSAIAGVTASTEIPEKPLTRVEAYLNKIVENGGGGGGGGFTPTDAQLDAMNSGITSEDVEQISTNKNNISKLTPNYAISVCPVTNDYSCIAALTQTIPTASIARISATIDKGNTSVRGIILSLTDDISTFNNGDNLLAKDEQSVSDKRILTVDVMYYNGSSSNTIPVYIWVKGEGTGAVMGYSSLEKLK